MSQTMPEKQMPEKREAKTVAQVPVSNVSWPFEAFRREFDQLFDRFSGPGWLIKSSLGMGFPVIKDSTCFAGPAVDVIEREQDFEITAELPGLDAKNIEVNVADNRMTIMGEKKEQNQEKGRDHYLSERRYGTFIRSFSLPHDIDAANIEAQFSNGVLTIKVPKSVDAVKKDKPIDIRAA
jgi:HSP20 family protein